MPMAVPLEDQVAALAGAIDKITRNDTKQDDQIKTTAEQVTDLYGRVKKLGAGKETDEAPHFCWLLAGDPAQAYEQLAHLVDWVERVYLRYPRTALPSCWMWHPWAVEELLVLKDAHSAAYAPKTAPKDRLDFHEKYLPNVRDRIDEELGTHTLELHQDRDMLPPPVPVADPMTVSRVVPEWVDNKVMPHPTGAEIADAFAYDERRQQLQSDTDYRV